MLKLHHIYLKKFIILFSLLFLVIGGIIHYWLKDIYIQQTKNSLIQKINLVSFHLKAGYNLDELAVDVKKDLEVRLTVIDSRGIVIAESHEDKNFMDNHKYREEIIQLKKSDIGWIIRHSDTTKNDYLYVAKKFDIKGKIYYIRIAKAIEEINAQMFKLGIEVAVVLIIFFILLFYASFTISKEVQKEIALISKFLLDLTKKRKSTYIKSEFSQEFSQITTLLTKVSKILNKKEKQKAKYTAKLRASNEQKDDIISAISHEFKNPIAVINGYSQTLIDDTDMNKEIQKKFLNKIYKSGTRLSSLIDTLRLSIKLDEGKQPLRYTNIKLHSLTQDLIESLQSNYKNRHIDIIGDTDTVVRADETLLSIAIVNLIENALKYSEDTVTVNLNKDMISITDTGIGIKEKYLESITTKFYRVSTNGWNNSLGLGLSIVSNIVNMHNFKLDIKTKENEGSTFTIRF